MRTFIVTALSALGVGLLIATPDQAKADFTLNCTSTSSGLQSASSGLQSASSGLQSASSGLQSASSGLQSGSFTGDITIDIPIDVSIDVLPPSTSNCVNSNPGNSLLPNLYIGNGINLNPVIFQNQKRR